MRGVCVDNIAAVEIVRNGEDGRERFLILSLWHIVALFCTARVRYIARAYSTRLLNLPCFGVPICTSRQNAQISISLFAVAASASPVGQRVQESSFLSFFSYRCMKMLRSACFASYPKQPPAFSVINKSTRPKIFKFEVANYESPGSSIGLPIFGIHGNHGNEATGFGMRVWL